MKLIYHDSFKLHTTGMHPENQKRFAAFSLPESSDILFNEKIIEIIHTRDYIERVKVNVKAGLPLSPETPVSSHSYEAAVYAANATVLASQGNDFALVRPPGHHAFSDHASGFCIFNNVAIASQRFVHMGKRVLIFDYDGHLGDGTFDIFKNSDQVMYWSIHQYPAFPGHGTEDETGEGTGSGYTINVPLPPGSGDDIYFDALHYTLPFVKKFNPDVVAVSAGFDAHQNDLLLDLRLSANAFYKTGQLLADNFDAVFATLEGGYNVEELQICVTNFIDGINGVEPTYLVKMTESDIKVWAEYNIRIDKLLINLKSHWDKY